MATITTGSYLANVEMLGGITTDANSLYTGLVVSGTDFNSATALHSGPFDGVGGSVIRALNSLGSTLQGMGGVSLSGNQEFTGQNEFASIHIQGTGSVGGLLTAENGFTAVGTVTLPADSVSLDAVSGITATSGEINLLDATAGSTVALSGADGVLMWDATDSNNAKKVLMSDLEVFMEANLDTLGTQMTSAAGLATVGTIGTGVWQGTAIATGYIAADAIDGTKIADDAIDSEHYAAGSVDNVHLANSTVAFGGVSLALGAADTTPAFNLSDATAYLGDSDLVTVGTVASGVWNGTAVASAYLDSDTAHLSVDQTFSGVKSFSAAMSASAGIEVGANKDVVCKGSGGIVLYDSEQGAYKRLAIKGGLLIIEGVELADLN